MDNFLRTPASERLAIFSEAGSRLGMNITLVEKDFWVCWILKHLFSNQELFENMVFKGGTSLSKSYSLIDRFSEDCDLTINRQILNVKDPGEAGISGNELQRRIEVLMLAIKAYIRDFILPILENKCKDSLKSNERWKLEIDQDNLTILFTYPTADTTDNRYVKRVIRLEFGARGGTFPKKNTVITPYIDDCIPDLLLEETALIPTLLPERTFWEKITILHGMYHRRLKGKEIAARMSRHYYDVYMLIKRGVDKNAMLDLACLDDVTKNNIVFFKDNNASQNTAKLGSFCLVPNAEMLEDLHQDYQNMEVMILGEAPSFEVIMRTIKQLEMKLNQPD